MLSDKELIERFGITNIETLSKNDYDVVIKMCHDEYNDSIRKENSMKELFNMD